MTTLATAFRARQSRRAAIERFFLEHLGERFSTSVLHERFGPAFRTRVSEINRDSASLIQILNATSAGKDALSQPCERSVYWAQLRDRAEHPSNPESGQSDYLRREREERAHAMPLFAETVRR